MIVKELLAAGLLDGAALTCTGETLAEQVRRLDPPPPDGDVIHPVAKPYKATGGLRLLHGNLAPDGGAVLKIAGIEGGLQDGVFCGRLDDANEFARRAQAWRAASDANTGVHPDVTPVSSRVLTRMRTSARPALRGAGMETG